MTSTFKRSIPAAATFALALMFGAQAQAQTPLPATSPAVVKGDQMAPPAAGATGAMSSTAPVARMPSNSNESNSATPAITKAKTMTMEERNESRTKREMAVTNGGTTSAAANNGTDSAISAVPQATGKTMASNTRAERKAKRDAKRMKKSGMEKSNMVKPAITGTDVKP